MKCRRITINLNEVYRDIDSLTYKYAEVSDIPSPSAKSGMQSDSGDSLDGRLLSRAVEYRDAKLRTVIGRYLAQPTQQQLEVSNVLVARDSIVYDLELDDEFQDSMLMPLCSMMSRYLTYGALFDWYGPGMGSRQAANYELELTGIETELVNNLQAVTIVQKTKQPFARRLY